jgi:phenylpropionate dioxygenase-like ring-hydroxylating dioxygenase large terminal subunit
MSTNLKSYLGLTETSGDTVPLTALPASWYTSPDMFELERRAIFSRKWLLTTHKLRLFNTGDWLRYDIAGFGFILVRDREGNINAFHNVCRHRAFPVVTEGEGTSRIFSCKYHGWSYGLNGKLAKAPGYQDLEGFDKSKNSLLPIHVHIDVNGFIWVNLDSKDTPELSWEEEFQGVDLQSQFQDLNVEDYSFDHAWEREGEFNWKTLANDYNEGYDTKTSHPDIPSLSVLSHYSFDANDGSITHSTDRAPERSSAGQNLTSSYYFPNTSMVASPHFFFLRRFVPVSATSSIERYEVYRSKSASDEEFELVKQLYKNLKGEVHPTTDKGPLYFQSVVREIVINFHKREEELGQAIWPSRQVLPATATTSQEDIDFCAKLTTQTPANADCGASGGCCGGVACASGNEALAY